MFRCKRLTRKRGLIKGMERSKKSNETFDKNLKELKNRLFKRYHMLSRHFNRIEGYPTIYFDSQETLIEKKRQRFGSNFQGGAYVRELSRIKPHALDYVKQWDAIYPLILLNWVLTTSAQAVRLDFAEKLRLEYPSKTFYEAVEEITDSWRHMKEQFGENRLLNDEDFYTYQKYRACPWLIDFAKVTLEDVKALRRGEVSVYAISYSNKVQGYSSIPLVVYVISYSIKVQGYSSSFPCSRTFYIDINNYLLFE